MGAGCALFGALFVADPVGLWIGRRSERSSRPPYAFARGACLASAVVVAGSVLHVVSDAVVPVLAVGSILAGGMAMGEILARRLDRAEWEWPSNPRRPPATAIGTTVAVALGLWFGSERLAEVLRREATIPELTGDVRTISLPPEYPFGPPTHDGQRIVPPPGLSYTVPSPDGAHVLAMIPRIPVAQELELARSEEVRARTRLVRDRYPASGLYTSGALPELVWEFPSYAYCPVPEWVVLPSGGRHLVLVESAPGLGFYRDGEGVGDRAIERLGKGGSVGDGFTMALDDARQVVCLSIPSMGNYELDVAAGGDVVRSIEGPLATVDPRAFLASTRWLLIGLHAIHVAFLGLWWTTAHPTDGSSRRRRVGAPRERAGDAGGDPGASRTRLRPDRD